MRRALRSYEFQPLKVNQRSSTYVRFPIKLSLILFLNTPGNVLNRTLVKPSVLKIIRHVVDLVVQQKIRLTHAIDRQSRTGLRHSSTISDGTCATLLAI